jgi:ribosomal protein S18 acetylase RimI-like enzyme
MSGLRDVRFRARPLPADAAVLRRLVAATGVFHAKERAVALELLATRLSQGPKSGYSFVFAERGGEMLGYAVWGRTPLTRQTFDLYWIVVAPAAQGHGLGRALLKLVQRAVARRGGGNLYIETSSRPAYVRTRRFYREAGYAQVARLRDFYAPGDHKILFCKQIAGRGTAPAIAARRRRRAAFTP